MTIEAYSDILDFPGLLADISPESPCGDDTREDSSPNSPYFTLKDLRSQARALERQVLVDDEVVQVPQWRRLVTDIPVLLAERTKDLEYVAWLIEALCRERGFEGLAAGFALARVMLERHWENLYPLPDEDGLSTRIGPLVGLNGLDAEGTLVQPILSVPLFVDDAGNAFATWHAEQAAEVARLDESRAKSRLKAGAVSPEELLTAVAFTPVQDLAAIRSAILRSQEEYAALNGAIDEVMQGEPQPSSNVRAAMDRCLAILNHHAGERIDAWLAERQEGEGDRQQLSVAEVADGQGHTDVSQVVDPVKMAIENRSQALKELRRLSDFFLKTEPHSPVAYAIRQAVRWSELSLPELMEELIADSGAREGFYRLTGVPAPEPRE